MNINSPKAEKAFRYITLFSLAFLVFWGARTVFSPIRPFWVDEWRVIYNLKFKSPSQLWGHLDYMQQFPRVYLQIVKWFTQQFRYSYTALRLPAFIAGITTVIVIYRLANKVYPRGQSSRFLFIMIFISSFTFIEYLAQVKQYTMELLLSIAVLWQLLGLQRIKREYNAGIYLLLCASFCVFPFFSYTYAIVVAPVYVLMAIDGLYLLRSRSFKAIALVAFPLVLGAIAIAIFYKIDAAQVMKDSDMRKFWTGLFVEDRFGPGRFFYVFYFLFAQVGAGFVFEKVFGVVGMSAFIFYSYKGARLLFSESRSGTNVLLTYSLLLIYAVFALFLLGKLPLPHPRLNAFTVPAIAVLIVGFLESLSANRKTKNVGQWLILILFVAVSGNIFTSYLGNTTGSEYARKLAIYHQSQAAVRRAQELHIPILVTPGFTYPFERTFNYPLMEYMPGDWPLKTLPAYDADMALPVHGIADTAKVADTIAKRFPDAEKVMVGDGLNYRVWRKPSGK